MKTLIIALLALNMGVATAAPEKVTKISLESKGEENVYKQNKFSAKPGAKIEVTLKNNSSSMQHNFVLVKPGKEQTVGIAAMSAMDNHYIPKKETPAFQEIIFAGPLVDPKKSATFTFTAPTEKGEYPFICTFPGHFTTMKGVLSVK